MEKINWLKFILVMAIWWSTSGQACTKVIVYGKNYNTSPQRAFYQTDRTSVLEAIRKTLEKDGYQILTFSPDTGQIVTGWLPVESDSHFVLLFDRKDVGLTDGAYYQLTADVSQEGPKVKVLVGTTIKSIAGKMDSTGKVEKRLLGHLENLLRAPQIEMTNVGVDGK